MAIPLPILSAVFDMGSRNFAGILVRYQPSPTPPSSYARRKQRKTGVTRQTAPAMIIVGGVAVPAAPEEPAAGYDTEAEVEEDVPWAWDDRGLPMYQRKVDLWPGESMTILGWISVDPKANRMRASFKKGEWTIAPKLTATENREAIDLPDVWAYYRAGQWMAMWDVIRDPPLEPDDVLFGTVPSVYTEQQLDHTMKPRKGPVNYGLSCGTFAAMGAIDALMGIRDSERDVGLTAAKEGVKRNRTRTYTDAKNHKQESIAHGISLCQTLGDQRAHSFLLALDAAGFKLDDFSDCLNMAFFRMREDSVQWGVEERKRARIEKAKIPRTPVAPTRKRKREEVAAFVKIKKEPRTWRIKRE